MVTKILRQKGSRMVLRLLAVVVLLDVPMLRLMKFMVLRTKFLFMVWRTKLLPTDMLIL